jgi:GNAT superfamily N-acetyltransferase
VWVSDAGWPTRTTALRLRDIGANVYHKNRQQHLNNEPWDGDWKLSHTLGGQANQFDWRPNEVIPEDQYLEGKPFWEAEGETDDEDKLVPASAISKATLDHAHQVHELKHGLGIRLGDTLSRRREFDQRGSYMLKGILDEDSEHRKHLKRPHDHIIYQVRNGIIRGGVLMEPQPEEGKMSVEYLASTHRGGGTALLHAAEQRARELGLHTVRLDALFSAVPFYKKMGYKFTSGEDSPAVIDEMQKRVAPPKPKLTWDKIKEARVFETPKGRELLEALPSVLRRKVWLMEVQGKDWRPALTSDQMGLQLHDYVNQSPPSGATAVGKFEGEKRPPGPDLPPKGSKYEPTQRDVAEAEEEWDEEKHPSPFGFGDAGGMEQAHLVAQEAKRHAATEGNGDPHKSLDLIRSFTADHIRDYEPFWRQAHQHLDNQDLWEGTKLKDQNLLGTAKKYLRHLLMATAIGGLGMPGAPPAMTEVNPQGTPIQEIMRAIGKAYGQMRPPKPGKRFERSEEFEPPEPDDTMMEGEAELSESFESVLAALARKYLGRALPPTAHPKSWDTPDIKIVHSSDINTDDLKREHHFQDSLNQISISQSAPRDYKHRGDYLNRMTMADDLYHRRTEQSEFHPHTYYALYNGHIRGGIHAEPDFEDGDAMYVDTLGSTHKGIGHRLMRTIEQHAKAHGYKRVTLSALPGAVGFYTKLGYRKMTDDPHKGDRPDDDLVPMRKDFGGLQEGLKEDLEALTQKVHSPDGGATYHVYTHKQPKTGFVVSPYQERSEVMSAKRMTLRDLVKYAKKNRDLLHNTDHYLGVWHDPATHKAFMDISVVANRPSAAVRIAKEHDQKAYFDLDKMASVVVDPKATSGGVV